MCEQNASYLAKHSELGSKNLNKICQKITQKALILAITACKFSKIFRGSICPRTPLEHFLYLNQFQTCSAEKKNTLKKNVVIIAPPPPPFQKFSLRHGGVCNSVRTSVCNSMYIHRPTYTYTVLAHSTY